MGGLIVIVVQIGKHERTESVESKHAIRVQGLSIRENIGGGHFRTRGLGVLHGPRYAQSHCQ